jgi:hypothetical protein
MTCSPGREAEIFARHSDLLTRRELSSYEAARAACGPGDTLYCVLADDEGGPLNEIRTVKVLSFMDVVITWAGGSRSVTAPGIRVETDDGREQSVLWSALQTENPLTCVCTKLEHALAYQKHGFEAFVTDPNWFVCAESLPQRSAEGGAYT